MIKRWIALLAALVLAAFPIIALAEGEATPSASSSATPSVSVSAEATPSPTPPPSSLSVDTAHVYAGMDRSYDQGYAPKVSKGYATVLLPLVASNPLQGNVLTATPSLGDPSGAPFVFRSYIKTVPLSSNAVTGGAVSGYLIRFDLKLKGGRINGVYPVAVAVTATGTDGAAVSESYTVYVTISDGKDPNAATAPPPVAPSPKVVVSQAKVDPSTVVAGQPFTATVTLKNQSKDQDISALKVTAAIASADFAPLQGSDTIYLDKLAAGATAELTWKYQPALKTAAQQYTLALTLEYNDEAGAALNATANVPFAVTQPLRVQLDPPKVPENINAGDTVALALQLMNLGRGTVYNARAELDVPGMLPTETAFFGNLEAGSAKTAAMDVFVGTRDMSKGHENEEKYGYTEGKLRLTYEDEDGKEYTLETDINTTIGEPVIPAAAAQENDAPKKASQWWATILIGVAVVGALAAALILRSRRGNHEKH